MQKRWKVASSAPRAHLDQFPGLAPLLVQVLYNRGVVSPDEVHGFLDGTWSEGDPFDLPDMARATDSLIRAITNRVPIAVYGDFDADGVTATALMVQTLVALGADVREYIPNRVDEGYGLNLKSLRALYQDGVRLVVTVDCGTRAVEEIGQARRGIEFIVTDHHSVGQELPRALAVINPKRDDSAYPFRSLAGVGVAYKLAQALIEEARECGVPVHIEEQSLLDLVALGSVSDMVPLVGENRHLVRRGLEVLNQGKREGLKALLQKARLGSSEVDAATIGFGLGPRLNAAGRLGDARLSYRLLVTADKSEAWQLARQLDEKNQQRQTLTSSAYQRAESLALSRGEDAPLLYAADPSFMSGIVGLVAARLTDTYYRPSVVIEEGEEVCKGSCRSIGEFHITRALDECRDLLVRHGGHAAAAGFTVRRERLDPLMERLSDIAAQQLSGQDLMPTIHIDASVPAAEMGWDTVDWVRKLEPCGEGNPAPIFSSEGVVVLEKRGVGSENQHLKLILDAGGQARDAIGFRLGSCASSLGDRVDLVYTLQVNEWNGDSRLQFHLLDVRSNNG